MKDRHSTHTQTDKIAKDTDAQARSHKPNNNRHDRNRHLQTDTITKGTKAQTKQQQTRSQLTPTNRHHHKGHEGTNQTTTDTVATDTYEQTSSQSTKQTATDTFANDRQPTHLQTLTIAKGHRHERVHQVVQLVHRGVNSFVKRQDFRVRVSSRPADASRRRCDSRT